MACKQLVMTSLIGATLLSGMGVVAAKDFKIDLEGFQEVPAVSTTGSGTFALKNEPFFDSKLVYEDLEGEIIQAHIHLGQRGVNGGIMIWLCANPNFDLPLPAVTPPPCVGSSGSVERQLMATDVIGPEAQGIELDAGFEALRAIRRGVAYVNVHSTRFPSGEIRGQLWLEDSDEDFEELRKGLEELRDDVDDLQDDFENHTHEYLTGRGNGHNNTEATTGPPEF